MTMTAGPEPIQVKAAPAPPTARSERRRLRTDIEGLRAIAVVSVMVLHAGLPVPGGFVGVDIFFVISGYLMTSILLRELLDTGWISLPRFYARRAKRLLPAALTVLVATALATAVAVPRIRWSDIAQDIVASALYVQNWRLAHIATDYNAIGLDKSPLQHFWSLAVEEQFYFVWPALILLMAAIATTLAPGARPADRQVRATLVAIAAGLGLVAAASLVWSIHLTAAEPAAAYFVTTTRLWELAIGGAVALALAGATTPISPRVARPAGWLGLAMMLAAIVLFDEATPFPGVAALLPTVGTALVIWAGTTPVAAGPGVLLDRAPMQWLGALSYSLYLWHWPALIITAAWLGRDLSPLEGTIVVCASAIPAYLSYRLIERTFRRATIFNRSPAPTLQLGLACTVGSALAGLALLAAVWPAPPPPAPVAIALPATDDAGTATDSAGTDGAGTATNDAGTADEAAPQQKIGALVLADDPRNDPAGAPTDSVPSITPDPLAADFDVAEGGCIKEYAVTDATPCLADEEAVGPNVAMVGDSHSAQWLSAMTNIANQRGWRLSIFNKQNCTYALGLTVSREGDAGYDECTEWDENVAAALADLKPAMVVVSDVDRPLFVDGARIRQENSFDLLVEGYKKAWQPLLDSGTKVVALKDTPRPGYAIPPCVAENPDKLTECTFARDEALRNGTALEAAATSTPGVTFVNLEDAICPTDQCAPVIGGVLIYRDSNHMTSTYAATLAPRLDAALPAIGS